jgi:hypothetical protein
MTKLWSVMCAAVVATGLAAPTEARAQFDFCSIPILGPLFCPPDFVDEQELAAALQPLEQRISQLEAALATLTGRVDQAEMDIDSLEQALQDLIDLSVDCNEVPGFAVCDDKCFNIQTSEEHCGACGNACEIFEDCVDGACVVRPCPNASGDPNGECNNAQRNEDNSCTYTPKRTGLACNDNNGCTPSDRTICSIADGATTSSCSVTPGPSTCPDGETCFSTGPDDDDHECVPE